MQAIPAFAVLIARSLVTPLIAADKSPASKANVEQTLNSQYPGSILVVGRNGIGEQSGYRSDFLEQLQGCADEARQEAPGAAPVRIDLGYTTDQVAASPGRA